MRTRLDADPDLLELLTLLAGAPASRERDAGRIRALAAGCDEAAIVAALERQRLLAVLGERLIGALADPPASLRAVVDGHHAVTRRRAQMQAMVLGRVLSALADAGIRAVSLKGPAFAAETFGDAGKRLSGDLDVLVGVGDLDAALATVTALGYESRGDRRGADGLPMLHLAASHPSGLPTVELHWRVHWHETRFAQEALARADGPADGLRLRPEDELAFLLLFDARDGLSGLRFAVDAVTWLERHPDALATLPAVAAAHPALAPSLRVAAHHVLTVEGQGREAAFAPAGRRERVARRLADPGVQLTPKQVMAERGLFDLLTSERPLEAARRQLIPGRRSLRTWAPEVDGRPSLGVTASHVSRSLRRYALAWSTRRGRPTDPRLS